MVVSSVGATGGGAAPFADGEPGAVVGVGDGDGVGDDFGAGVSAGAPNPSGNSDSCAIAGSTNIAASAVADRPNVNDSLFFFIASRLRQTCRSHSPQSFRPDRS